jgi:hypothetical protein
MGGKTWAVISVIGAGLVVAAQTSPEQAVSNLAGWARLLGVDQMPNWLGSTTADTYATVIGALVVLASLYMNWPRLLAILGRSARPPQKNKADRLAEFVEQARKLQFRCRREPEDEITPVYNAWKDKVTDELRVDFGKSYAVLFNDFSGLTQFAAPRQTRAETRLNYHIQRLTQFIQKHQ